MEGELSTTKIETSQSSQHEFKEVVHEKIDDSPIKIVTSQSSQHEFKEIEAEVVHEKVDDSPIKIESSQSSQHEFKEIEAEVVHEKVDDSPIKIETSQSSQHEFKAEKVDDSPIKIESSQHEFKEIEAEVVHEKVDDSPIKIESSQSSQHEFKEIEAEVVHEKVDDSPIKIESSPFQHEFEEIEAEVIHENKCLSLIPYEGSLFFNSYEKSLFFNLAEKQGDNMAEPKKDEMEDVNIDYPRTSENEITISVHKELEARVAMLKALPSPERKRILGLTPRKISEASIKQTSSSSVNRFAKTHEKAFSQMPSIMTHYAAQKTKKAEEIQDEINRKRKDLGGMQPLIKKRKLANSTAKEVAKSSVRLGVTQHVLKKKTKEGVAKKPKPSLLPRRVSGIQKKMSK